MPKEYIKKQDSLNQGREKLNRSIDRAYDADTKSDKAFTTSNESKNIAQTAEDKADSVQSQFNQVVIEGDSSVESAQARVGADGTTYPVLKERLDGEHEKVTAQLAQTESQLIKDKNILNIDYGKVELPDDFPHDLPFDIFVVDENTIEHTFDINEFKKGEHGSVYLDYTVGVHGNGDGLTPDTPVYVLRDALNVANSLPNENVTIYLMNKYFPRTHFLLPGEVTLTKNITFAPYGRDRSFFGNFEDPLALSWTKDGKAYKTERSATEKILDLSILFKETEPTEYTKVSSVVDVQNKQGSFYTDGTSVWIRRFDDKEPDDDIMVMVRTAGPSFKINDKRLIFDRVSWFFRNPNRDSLSVSGNENSELILYQSSVAHGMLNGLATINIGKVYNIESLAYGNGKDGFNYHGKGGANPYEFVYEYRIESFDNGSDGLDNNNASTAHDGMSILRVDTLNYDTEGPIVADVNGCYSILINCISHSSRRNVSSRLKSAFFFNNTSAVKPGKAILINCGGGGKDTYALATDSGFDLQVRRFKGSNWWPETLDGVEFI